MSMPADHAAVNTGKASSTFSRRTVIFMLILGFAAFFGLLYSLGVGDALRDTNNGQAHGASNSLVGYKALANMIEQGGHKVRTSRSAGSLDDEGLLVVTPGFGSDGEDLRDLIETRIYVGPTLVILPKWATGQKKGLKPGWVTLAGLDTAQYYPIPDIFGEADLKTGPEKPAVQRVSSPYADNVKMPGYATTLDSEKLIPLIIDSASGDALVSLYDNGGYYPEYRGENMPEPSDDGAYDYYPVLVTAEPDLFNNMGMADKATAAHALALIDTMLYDDDMPVTFDLTMVGLGASDNLLTLAFEPPFLSATICLIIAALAAAWMAFYRFGPATTQARAIDYGKGALVSNGAAFVRRLDRDYLLAQPYSDVIREQAATAIGLPHSLSAAETEKQLDKLGSHDGQTFTQLAWELRRAHKRGDIADRAAALYRWKKEMIR